MRVLALWVAGVGAASCAVVVATTLPSGGPFVPTWVIWALFPGSILIHVQTVRVARIDFKQRVLETPRPLLAPAVVLGACAFALSMHAVVTMLGVPERHDNRYYLRNHTELTRVSRSEYRYAEREIERLFCGIAFVFYAIAFLVSASPRPAALGRTGYTDAPRAPGPGSAGGRPGGAPYRFRLRLRRP